MKLNTKVDPCYDYDLTGCYKCHQHYFIHKSYIQHVSFA
jgi:hypothetical protein